MQWPSLLARIEADQLDVIKRSRSGDVLAGEIVLGGKPIDIIVKHPRRKYWYRHLNSIGRASRVLRMWKKAWALYARHIAVEWPLLVMEKRVLGYVTDSIIVFERMRGDTLSKMNLNKLQSRERDMMFRRLGRILRRIDELGWAHFDAKSSNWIIQPDEKLGAVPILIDVDGVRFYPWRAAGIDRLLRSLRDHPQYTPADSLALCQGYAPRAKLARDRNQEP
jgi:tRNA A-37 threonylcarbamoyl transferase component Bud32